MLALPVPNLMAYDPAFAYEIAIIIQDGIKRMYVDGESIFYYLTVGNEPLPMPEMPNQPGIREGILKGLYRFKTSEKKDAKLRAQLLGSGAIMFEVLKAQEILEKEYGVAADVWSVTSYKELYRDGQRLRALEHAAPNREAESAVCHADAQGRSRSIHRSIGLHEGIAGEHLHSGFRASWYRLAQTVSDAAKIAHRFGISSRSTRSTSCWQRCTRLPVKASMPSFWRRPSAIWASIPKSETRQPANAARSVKVE